MWPGTNFFKDVLVDKLADKFVIGSKVSKPFKYIGLNIENKTCCTTMYQIDDIQPPKPITASRGRIQEKSSERSDKEKAEYRTRISQLNWVATQ